MQEKNLWMRSNLLGYALCSALLGTSACASPLVYTSAATLTRPEAASSTLFVRSTTVPQETSRSSRGAYDGGGSSSIATGVIRMNSLNRRVYELLNENGYASQLNWEVNAEPRETPFESSVLFHVSVDDYVEDIDRADEDETLCGMLMVVTAGLSWLPCINTRHDSTHRVRATVSLYDLSQVPPSSRDGNNGTPPVSYFDLRGRNAVQRQFAVEVRSGIGLNGATSGELHNHSNQEGERIAEQIFLQLQNHWSAMLNELSSTRGASTPNVELNPSDAPQDQQ